MINKQEVLEINLDSDIVTRISKMSDQDYIVDWLINPKMNCTSVFPGIDPRGDFDLFAYAVKRWSFSFVLKASITIEANGIPLGISSFWLNDSVAMKHIALFGIVVDPDNSNKGLGSILMKDTIRFAKEVLELEMLDLQVVASNYIAINLYKKFGFFILAKTEKAIKIGCIYEDMITMRKEL